jgi:2-polyprenyl-3-methyl-5-hydroxy-6-metoxy-1,4-benzoquinol methylase
MQTTLKHEQAEIVIESSSVDNRKRIRVHSISKDLFVPITTCETSYPLELIEEIFKVTGPAYLCDEIMREESLGYVQLTLHYDLLSYIDQDQFSGKRILDFGCGSGASSMILRRMFPDAEIVGVELEEKLLAIARARARYYEVDGEVKFLTSRDENNLPDGIGEFDYIIMSAVYEHLLPAERINLLPLLWGHLKWDGILFLNQTPYRWFPVEIHTTSGLPLINYLPDPVALVYARYFSRRKLQKNDWDSMLRNGIRGASVREILDILNRSDAHPVLLEPTKQGVKDRVDLWYAKYRESKNPVMIKILYYFFKTVKTITGLTMVHNLSLAIKKSR